MYTGKRRWYIKTHLYGCENVVNDVKLKRKMNPYLSSENVNLTLLVKQSLTPETKMSQNRN